MKNFFTLCFLIATISVSAQQFADSYNRNQKVFIENKGQVRDQRDLENKEVLYLYHDGLFNLELKENGFSYEVFNVTEEKNGMYESGKRADHEEQEGNKTVRSHRVDVTFNGSNNHPAIQADETIKGYYNFIHAPVAFNQQLHVQAFKKITYNNIYDGIDLVFYAPFDDAAGTLRYEFMIHPGADLSRIQFKYLGATDFSIGKSGDFLINTSCGFIKETKPKYFIDGNEEGRTADFVLHKGIRSFSACNYDRTKFLIIDPDMIWGTYYGGEKADEIAEVAVGPDMKPVLDGQTVSFDHIATTGAYQDTYAGGIDDWFITKFNEDGSLYWSTYFGGNDKDYCYGLTVDGDNNVIAIGNSRSLNLATPGAFQETITGSNADILIAKFDPEGTLIWSTYFGSDSSEEVRNIVTDASDNLYLGGTTKSITGIASPGAFQDFNGGYDDALIIKFTSAGNRVWSTYYGDSGVDRIHAITLDLSGHVYIAGTTSSRKNIASLGAQQTGYGGGSEDAMLAKFDTSGSFIWGTYCGGSNDDRSRGVETDSTGNVYIGGFTNSPDSIATLGSHQDKIYPGNDGGVQSDDAYLVKFSSDGVRQWGTYLGGAHTEDLWGMTIDKALNAIYIVGSSNSTENIAFGNAIQPIKAGGSDCLFAKFLTDGSLEWSTYFGGLVGDQFEDVAVDKDHLLFVVARATAIDMPTSPNAYQRIFYGGASDAMMYKFYGGNDCYDPFEPNESLAAAKTVYPYHINYADTTVYGYNANIRNSNDQDWYTFSVVDSEPNIMAIISMYAVDLNLNLYNDQGILIYQSANGDTIPDTIAVNGLTAGNYFLEVPHAPADFDSLHCYRLQIFVSDSAFPSIGIATLISTMNNAAKLVVYPNPVHDQLSFMLPVSASSPVRIVIYDMLNRLVYSEQKNIIAGKQMVVPIRNLSAGPYTIIIHTDDNVWEGKFTRQ